MITAGNGLAGGGDISASRTITMGTPGAITAVSTDAVTATSHTHSLSAANVGIRLGQLNAGSVGTTGLFFMTGNTVARSPGFALAGTGLKWASVVGYNNGGSPGGTWELQGALQGNTQAVDRVSVWLRVI